MQYYSHELTNVEDYLHHRPPYLLVDKILSVNACEVRTEKLITGDEFFLSGHFPGAAVFPGAMLQEFTTQSAGILIAESFNPMPQYNTHDPHFNPIALGVLVQVKKSKFQRFAKPGDLLQGHIQLIEHTESVFDFRGKIEVEGQVIMRNEFRLANVESKLLYA